MDFLFSVGIDKQPSLQRGAVARLTPLLHRASSETNLLLSAIPPARAPATRRLLVCEDTRQKRQNPRSLDQHGQ